jgi:hypothetical protein
MRKRANGIMEFRGIRDCPALVRLCCRHDRCGTFSLWWIFLSVSCPERERQAEGEVKSRQHQNNVAASAINNSVTMIRLGISKLSPVCGAGVEAGVESVVGVPALLLLAAGDVGVTGSVIFVQEG